MAEHCNNCSAELFDGAHFCRACGRPTEEISGEHAPTRMMQPQQAESFGARGPHTAPTANVETGPVYAPPRPYQPPGPPMYAQGAPPYQPPPKKAPVGWIVAIICAGVFFALVAGIVFVSRVLSHRGGGSRPSGTMRSGETALDESSAETVNTSATDTTYVKSFHADGDTEFSIQNVSGNVAVESWDKDQIEVKATKRGGSDSDRASTQIFFSQKEDKLSFRTASTKSSVEVRYEVRVPRGLSKVNLGSVSGSLKLSGVKADISANTVSGAITLLDVAGLRSVKTTSGDVTAVIRASEDDHPIELASVSGNIDVQIKDDLAATFNADSVTGAISVDDSFGVNIEKGPGHQRASGKIGDGGTPIRIKTVSGNIKLRK